MAAPASSSEPLQEAEEASEPSDIPLSADGCLALVTYWVFSATVFDAHHPLPSSLYLIPSHSSLLHRLLNTPNHWPHPAALVASLPGIIDATLALGLWLHDEGRIVAPANSLPTSEKVETAEGSSSSSGKQSEAKTAESVSKTGSGSQSTEELMRYHHLITLAAIFHQSPETRNAATVLAGSVLHSLPDPRDRLAVLDDLLDNCVFSALTAAGIGWLREELVAASPRHRASSAASKEEESPPSPFSTPQALEHLQYAAFPNLTAALGDGGGLGDGELAEWWGASHAVHAAAVSLFVFLFRGDGACDAAVPAGMEEAVEQRYLEPLRDACLRLESMATVEGGGTAGGGLPGEGILLAGVLAERLKGVLA